MSVCYFCHQKWSLWISNPLTQAFCKESINVLIISLFSLKKIVLGMISYMPYSFIFYFKADFKNNENKLKRACGHEHTMISDYSFLRIHSKHTCSQSLEEHHFLFFFWWNTYHDILNIVSCSIKIKFDTWHIEHTQLKLTIFIIILN